MLKNYINNLLFKLSNYINRSIDLKNYEDKGLILLAKNLMTSNSWLEKANFENPKWIQDKEFRVYSQFGDDGIIQWLINFLGIESKNFIEFGVGNFHESNSHFLLVNNSWNGFIIDSSKKNITTIKNSEMYWRYNLRAELAFIDKNNINLLLELSGFKKLGYLHIDLDGNDYWILDTINLKLYEPDILILEYNAVFGNNDEISVPYDKNFNRMKAHYSGKYWGASLKAFNFLAEKKDYYFIGCNSAGNNAYFLHRKFEKLIPKTNIDLGFQDARYRDSREKNSQNNKIGKLQYLSVKEQRKQIQGLQVVNVKNNSIYDLK